MSSKCIEISSISKHLAKAIPKTAAKEQKFLLIDIEKYILYTPILGYYECRDFGSLKELLLKTLDEVDIDKVFLSRGVDEKWIEQNMKFLLGTTTMPNLLMFASPPKRNTSSTTSLLAKLINVIPLKSKKLIIKKRTVNSKTLVELIDMYASILR